MHYAVLLDFLFYTLTYQSMDWVKGHPQWVMCTASAFLYWKLSQERGQQMYKTSGI